MKKWHILFIALFFGLCLVPGVGLLIAGPSEAAANEAPAAAPRLTRYDGALNTEYLTELSDYVGRGFFLRLEGITGWDWLCARLLRTSANDDVLLGPDGWLFYSAELDDITGANQMTDAQIAACARSLYLMQEYAGGQGARFVFAVPCGKYTVYPAHAPRYVTVAEGGNLARLNAALDAAGVCRADLYAPFAASDETLYWQWDSHWNGKGAALAADAILTAAGREDGVFAGGFTEAERHTGDLYSMLLPRGTATEADYVSAAPFAFSYTSDFHSYDDMTITTERAGAEGALMLMRDSSGRNLYPYLAERFGSAYITRANAYPLYLIDRLGTTVVVAELCERNLYYLLKYPAIYPAPARGGAVPEGTTPVDTAVTADESSEGPAGYARLSGALPGTAERVYLLAGDTVYEAIPGDASFTAWLPEGTDAGNVRVYIPS